MKKFISLALILVFAISLCSCGVPELDEVRGSVSGDVYENSYLGLKFTKPSSWDYATEDEIAQVAGTTEDVLNEGGIDETVDAARYDMMASDAISGNNINLSLDIVGNTASMSDLDATLDEVEAQLTEMGSSIGMTYTFGEHSKVKLSGIEFTKLSASAEYYGIAFEQGCYIAVKDGVCVNISITSYDGTPVTDIEALFS